MLTLCTLSVVSCSCSQAFDSGHTPSDTCTCCVSLCVHLVYSLIVTYIVCYIQDGSTALHAACQEGKEQVVEALVVAKADLNLQTNVSDVTCFNYSYSSPVSFLTCVCCVCAVCMCHEYLIRNARLLYYYYCYKHSVQYMTCVLV